MPVPGPDVPGHHARGVAARPAGHAPISTSSLWLTSRIEGQASEPVVNGAVGEPAPALVGAVAGQFRAVFGGQLAEPGEPQVQVRPRDIMADPGLRSSNHQHAAEIACTRPAARAACGGSGGRGRSG